MEKSSLLKSKEESIYIKKQSAEKQRGVSSYKEPCPTEKLNQKINLLKNNNIYTFVIEYLNKKTGKNFKRDREKTENLM